MSARFLCSLREMLLQDFQRVFGCQGGGVGGFVFHQVNKELRGGGVAANGEIVQRAEKALHGVVGNGFKGKRERLRWGQRLAGGAFFFFVSGFSSHGRWLHFSGLAIGGTEGDGQQEGRQSLICLLLVEARQLLPLFGAARDVRGGAAGQGLDGLRAADDGEREFGGAGLQTLIG